MPQIASFVVGFILAQATWWFAARTSGGTDEYALGGAPTFRFLMLAGVEVLIAAIVFGAVMVVASRSRTVPSSTKSNFVSLVAGATTATIAAGPYALIPRVVEGELMLLIYILAAAVVSAAFGALVAMAFRGEPISEAQAIADNS